MRCSACGVENHPGARFCNGCGAAQAATCASCGQNNPPGSRFCDACGEPLSTPARTTDPAPGPAPTSPRSYTPRHLAEKILAGRNALQGERKQVTVLFADVVGSTDLVRDRDAEDAQRLLDGATRVMMDAVHRYEGTVSRAMGDGILALFGAPIAHEDHAVRACYAALALQDGMRRSAEETGRRYGARLQARVGLNSGEVIVRLISDDLHMDYTAMGPTVHLASRMEQLALPGGIALTPNVLALVEGYVQVRTLGPMPIKGLAEPLDVFELVGAGATRTRLQASAARGLTRFVGRDAEMEALYAALARASTGHGQVAALVGEPGVGKSRLVWELTHSHRTDGWLVLESGSVSYGKATSYLPVIDLLKGYCRIETRDDARTIREKVTGKLLALDRALEGILSPLLALLDVPVEDDAWDALDPPRRRRRTLDAVKRLILRESREQPLLLVFEDLHWIDAETQALLDGLIESVPTARVLLLVNYRPEYTHRWGNRGYYIQLRIDPLGQASAEDLLASLLGEHASVASLRPLLIQRTEGNPFFLEESVRSLVETGALVGEPGAYRLVQDRADVRVPPTVQAILAARIDRLPPDDKRLLQTAAVVGKDVPFALLQAIAELSEDDLQRGLSQLRAAEFLYEASLFPEPEYTFKHALTHEVAYGSLLQERRRALHAQIVDAIERLHAERRDEHVERLVYHAMHGQLWERAVGYALRAGQRAIERSANIVAIGHLTAGLDVLERLPSDDARLQRELQLLTALGPALMPTKGYGSPEVERIYARALEICRQLGESAQMFPVLRGLWEYYEVRADLRTARELAEELLRLASHANDSGLIVVAEDALGETLTMLGEFAPAREHLEQGIAHYDPAQHHNLARLHGGYDPGVMCGVWSAFVLWCLGYPDQSLRRCEEALALARGLSHPGTLPFALSVAAMLQQYRREAEATRATVEVVIAVSADQGFTFWGSFVRMLQGWAVGAQGQHQEGMAHIRQGLADWEATGARLERPLWLGLLAETCAWAGQVEEGLTVLAEALAVAQESGSQFHRAELHRLLGELLLDKAEVNEQRAEAYFREAIAVARQQHAKAFELRAATSLGQLWLKQGRRSEAYALLTDICGWFDQDGETADLRAARALLEQASCNLAVGLDDAGPSAKHPGGVGR